MKNTILSIVLYCISFTTISQVEGSEGPTKETFEIEGVILIKGQPMDMWGIRSVNQLTTSFIKSKIYYLRLISSSNKIQTIKIVK